MVEQSSSTTVLCRSHREKSRLKGRKGTDLPDVRLNSKEARELIHKCLTDLANPELTEIEVLDKIAEIFSRIYDRSRLYLREYRGGQWLLVNKVSRRMPKDFDLPLPIDDEEWIDKAKKYGALILRRNKTPFDIQKTLQPPDERVVSLIIVDDIIYGLISVDNKFRAEDEKHADEAKFTESDKHLVMYISSLLAQRFQREDLRQLNRIDEILTQHTDHRGLHQKILPAIRREGFEPDALIIRCVDEQSQEFITLDEGVYRETKSQSYHPYKIPLNGGIDGSVFKTKTPVFVEDIENNKEFQRDFQSYKKSLEAQENQTWINHANQVKSKVTGPLIRGKAVIGTFSLEFFKPHGFRTRERRFFDELLKKVSMALAGMEYISTLEAQAIAGQKFKNLALRHAGIGHQLKSRLQIIDDRLELLSGKNFRENREKIRQQVGYMNETINALSQLSGASAAGISLVSIAKLIPPLIDGYKTLYELEKHEIMCEVHNAPSIPPSFQNEAIIGVILDNIISNAIESMLEKGKGTLTVQSEYVAATGQIVIRISDTGCGIPKEKVKMLFAHSYSTKPGPGRGIGLALVLSFIDRLGGTIDVDSEVGKGTTFILTLPWKAGR